MQVLGWFLLSWACHHNALGENPGSLQTLPYNVRPAFRSCPCKGGGACLLREEYHGNARTREGFTYEGKTYFGTKVVRVDTGSCYCDQLSKNYFTLEDGKCPKLKNFCANVTCRNGGTCRNKMGYFFCDSCSAGFGGKTCSLNEKPLAQNQLAPLTMKFAQDVTIVWYPNSDFQHTWKTWFKISVSEPGSEFELWIEYLGIAYSIEIPLRQKTDESKACFDLESEDEVCKTYVKGRKYYTWNLSTKSSPQAAPYNLIFGPSLEKALKIEHRPKDWPFQIYAVKYPPIKISMYNSNTESFVQEFSMWSQVSSQTAGCYPEITFEGCGTDAKRPFLYMSREFVKIRAIVRKRSAICKNLVARLMQPIEFFEAEDTPMPKRLYHFKNGQQWQNDEDLSFVQKERRLFNFGSFYTAAFGIEVLGSYQSVIGEELQLHFNAMCFFKIAPPLSEVTVEGGSGTHDCHKPVEFRPLQTDDDFEEALFTLRWSCVDLKSPNSSQCAPIETSWGSITYRNLACDRFYHFKLEPFHDYFRLTSPAKSNVGKPFKWTVRTALGVTRISIKCKNSCNDVNTQNAVELEATESPASGFDPYWRIYEGNGISPLPLKEYTNILSNKWLMSIKENALNPGTTYTILVETEKGRGQMVFKTNSPPRGGTCSIIPSLGILGITKFTVTCRDWTDTHNPILYTVGVIPENKLFVPLVDSYYPDGIPPVSLFYKNVQVIIQDKFGLGTKYPLKVLLLDLYDPSHEDFGGKVEILNGQLAQDLKTVRNEVVRSAMVASLYEAVDARNRTAILENVRKITPFAGTLSDLEDVVKSIKLVLLKYTQRSALEDGVSDLILSAGQNIVLASEVFQDLCKNWGLRCSLENPQVRIVVKTLMQAVEVLFQTRDPHLDKDSPKSLDWKQVFQDKAKRGAMAALDGLSQLLGEVRVTMAPDFQPFIFTSGKITAFSAVGHAKTLQTQLDAFGGIAAATVKLSERSVALMGSYIYAVEVIVTDKDAYFWKPPSGNILHTKFFRWNHQSGGPTEIYMDDFGPFEIPINIELTDWDYRLVKGVALRADRSCSTECDSFVSLNRLRLPPGLGAVAVQVDPKHFGKIKLLAVQNTLPSYSELDGLKPHRRTRIEIKFNNQELISFFYIAVISAKDAVYNYELKVLLSSCAYYDSEEWQSQKCSYKATIKRKHGEYSVVCHCEHLSVIGKPNTSAWIDYIVKFPVPKLPYFSDIVLLGTLKDNWYVLAVVSATLFFYIVLLLYGGIKDKFDHRKESLMELSDNYPGDTYSYIIIVATGMRCRAGTSSKVGFQVVGSNSRSRPHLFRASKARTLQVAQDDWFLLFTRYDLGEIHEILVWHSNSGCSTDWYCSQITVYDVYRDTPYAFRVQRWFKIDPKNLDDSRMWRGQVNKIDWEVRETKVLKVFGDRFITSLREKHLWFSIFLRHARSRYSRCERVAILGALLFCTMLTSIIFFGSGDYVEVPGVGLSLDVEDLVEVFKGMVISMVTGSLLAFGTLFLFRVSKPKIEQPPPPDSPSEEGDEKQKGCCRRFWRCCSKCCRRKKKPPPLIYRPVVTEEALKARDAAETPQELQNLRIAAWVISFLLILGMSFFVILYGLRFGKKRSVLWIQSFLGTTLFDAMIWAPLKMAIGAYLLASIGLKAHAHDFSMQIDPNALWPSPLTYMERMDRMWCRLRTEYKPPSSRRLLKMSRVRAASDFCREYIMYFIFLGILFTFSTFFVVKFNTQGRFLATTALRRQLSERRTEGVYSPDDIVVANELVDYVNKTLLVALHRHRWYNGELLAAEPSEKRNFSSLKPDNERKGWCIGYLNKLIGVPRIRQQRISILPKKIISANWPEKYQYQYEIETKGIVSPYFKKYFNYSLGMLTALNEDTRTYKVGWELYNRTRDGNLTNLWEHFDHVGTQTGAYIGRLRRPYQGQGYVELLYWTREESARRFFETVSEGWIDNQTRAVMVEVTLYNVHLNMFTQFVVLAERLPAGVFSVRTLVDSSATIIPDAWTNTEMIMAYILILLLFVYSIYYFVQLSMHGVQAVMSWAGLFNIAIIIVGLTCVDHNFKRATRSGVFVDTLDTTPKDQFTSIYAYIYNETQAQVWSGIFVVLITACAVCAIHRLLGYERFTMIFNPVRPLFLMTILISYMMDLHSSACFDSLGLNDLSFAVVDGFFRTIPYQSLQHLSPRDQSVIIFFLPICFIFMKTVLGAVIFYYDRAAEEGTQKIGIAQIFPRRVSDKELHKALDKQDKVLEKKMAAVTNKIMQISKKQKKQKKKHKGELYFAPIRDDEAPKEVPAAGWLESVWGADHQGELSDLKEEPFPEAPLPQELLDDPNLQSLLESETSQPPKRPSDEKPKDEKKRSSEEEKPKDDKKRSSSVDRARDDRKQSGGVETFDKDKKLSGRIKKSKDDKPLPDTQKGRTSAKPSGTWMDADDTIPEPPSAADHQPEKSINGKDSKEPKEKTKPDATKSFILTKQPKETEQIGSKPSVDTRETRRPLEAKQSVKPPDVTKSEKTADRVQPESARPQSVRPESARPKEFEGKPQFEKSQPKSVPPKAPAPIVASQKTAPTPSKVQAEKDKPAEREKARHEEKETKPDATKPLILAKQPKETELIGSKPSVDTRETRRPLEAKQSIKPPDVTKSEKTADRVQPESARPQSVRPESARPKEFEGKPQFEKPQPTSVPPKAPAPIVASQKTVPTPSKAQAEKDRPAERERARHEEKEKAVLEPESPTKASGLNKWFEPQEAPKSREPKEVEVTPTAKPELGRQPRPEEHLKHLEKREPVKIPPRTAAPQTPQPSAPVRTVPPAAQAQPGPTPSVQPKIPPSSSTQPPPGHPAAKSKVPSAPSPPAPPTSQPLPDRPVAAQSRTKPDLVVPPQLDKGPRRDEKPQPVPPKSQIPPITSKTLPSPAPTKTHPEPWRPIPAPQAQPPTEFKVQPPPSRLQPSKMPPEREKPIQPEKAPPLPTKIPPGRDWTAKPADRLPQSGPSEPKKQLRFPPEVTSKPEASSDKDSRIPPHGARELPEPPSGTRGTTPDMTGVPSRGRRRSSRGRQQPITWLVSNARRLGARPRTPPRPPHALGPGVPGPSGMTRPRQVGPPPSRSPTAEPGEPPRPQGGKSPPTRSSDEPPVKRRRPPDATGPAVPVPSTGRPGLGPRPQVQHGPPRGGFVPGPPIRGRPKRTFLDWLLRRK